jgi:hypothetical protein
MADLTTHVARIGLGAEVILEPEGKTVVELGEKRGSISDSEWPSTDDRPG